MSEQIREQVSAFLDGELPNSETELLLKRLTRDSELRESFGRYALIGEALRGTSHPSLTKSFASRVNQAIDGEAAPAVAVSARLRAPRWWRPVTGAAVVAGVAAVAIVALQQRAIAPVGRLSAANVSAPAAAPLAVTPVSASLTAQSSEPLSYTVPVASTDAQGEMQSGRLTNYVFAHSKYSSGLGQRGVLADLLIEDDSTAPMVRKPKAEAAPARSAP